MVLVLEHRSTILQDFKADLTLGFSHPDRPCEISKVSLLYSRERLSNLSVLDFPLPQIRDSSSLPWITVLACEHSAPTSFPWDHSLTVVIRLFFPKTHISLPPYLQIFLSLQHNTKYTFCMNPARVPPSELFTFPMLPFFFIKTTTETPITEVLTFYLAMYMSLSHTGL